MDPDVSADVSAALDRMERVVEAAQAAGDAFAPPHGQLMMLVTEGEVMRFASALAQAERTLTRLAAVVRESKSQSTQVGIALARIRRLR